jgi:hypothetical protein
MRHHRRAAVVELSAVLQPDATDVVARDVDPKMQFGGRTNAVGVVNVLVEMLRLDQPEDVPGLGLEAEVPVRSLDQFDAQHRLRLAQQQLGQGGEGTLHRPDVVQRVIRAAEGHSRLVLVEVMLEIRMLAEGAQVEQRVTQRVLEQQPRGLLHVRTERLGVFRFRHLGSGLAHGRPIQNCS